MKDKIVAAIAAHPDEDTIELTMFRPSSQSVVILKSDVPFIIAALKEAVNHSEDLSAQQLKNEYLKAKARVLLASIALEESKIKSECPSAQPAKIIGLLKEIKEVFLTPQKLNIVVNAIEEIDMDAFAEAIIPALNRVVEEKNITFLK